jgi:NAD+ kinase
VLQAPPTPLELKRIGIFTSMAELPELLHRMEEWARPHGIEVIPLEWQGGTSTPVDLTIVFGGDGSVLSALVNYPTPPVLAINYGTVGFLTAGDREELWELLGQLLNGQYVISERSMLECLHPQGTAYAVNEVVIKGATRMITVELHINDHPIRKIRGDGVIVGTATGSTAYLLAAGSPIVMPELRCMIVSGLNEYDFRARQLVVTSDSHIRLKIDPNTREHDIYLSVDGKNKLALSTNEEVYIRESNRRARLLFPESSYFFQNLFSRLSW